MFEISHKFDLKASNEASIQYSTLPYITEGLASQNRTFDQNETI